MSAHLETNRWKRGNAGRPLVVIAEDDPQVRKRVSHWRKRQTYSVVTAADGARALEVIRTTQPAAVILDWMTPDVGEQEICRQLKDDAGTEDIPIVMLSTKGNERDVRAAFEGGVDEYLTKPFDMSELDHLLHQLIMD